MHRAIGWISGLVAATIALLPTLAADSTSILVCTEHHGQITCMIVADPSL